MRSDWASLTTTVDATRRLLRRIHRAATTITITQHYNSSGDGDDGCDTSLFVRSRECISNTQGPIVGEC